MSANTEMIRRSEAIKRFGVSKSTLDRWRVAGLIGWSRVDGVVWLDAGDIEDVRRAAYVPRQIVPLSPERAAANTQNLGYDWRSDSFWADRKASR